MHLISIELQGFKSFADRILLNIGSEITAIIGNKDSGKSNIIDAVRWVLGEQSTKKLRVNEMSEIIFNGNDNRKPMGFAEVSLNIHNSKYTLHMYYSEIRVTRRIYRSGLSEYFINRTKCRLKDIHEMFLGTGIGNNGFSITSIREIEEILKATPKRRRKFFDEASGIMRYKLRQVEAEKKLVLTNTNLKRINDIIFELQKCIDDEKITVEEKTKTKERYDFMIGQKKDMEQSKDKLVKVITELKLITTNQFIERFKRINVNFQKNVKKLFGEGTAEITLLDSGNVLECDIELKVQLPDSSELRNVKVLMGKERILTGIALLFSIIELRETPFCFLDDIDLGLDDIYLHRYIDCLKENSEYTQFIIATSNKEVIQISKRVESLH